MMEKLIAEADVFVTNMRVAALDRLGFHPKELHERYPRLIVSVISGFGMENAGEYADRAGLAMVAEAMAGATGLTRDHSGNAVWCGFALGDIMAGVSAHAGILLCAAQPGAPGRRPASSTRGWSSACSPWSAWLWAACRSRTRA